MAWHAVASGTSVPAALCGFRYTREPRRTWMQTVIPRRCPQCQRLVDEADAMAVAPTTRELGADEARQGAVPAN
jgi:hypothetical protein